VSVLPFADDAADFYSITLRNLAYCWLALAAGDAVRSRREAVEQAAAAAEEEALRRLGEERLRIARDVHDVVAHSMSEINVQAGVAAHLMDRDPEQARSALRHIKKASGDALTDLRATLGVLRGSDGGAPVEPTGGPDSLDELAAGLRAAGVQVALDVDELPPGAAAVRPAAYRIVQEALTNVLRHADATSVQVRVRCDGEQVTIDVHDDGTGSGAPGGSGQGIRGMRERAAALGGTLDGGPAPGGGPGGDDDVIRVVLADDQTLVRAGFRALLDAEDDMTVVGEAADGEQAVEVVRQERPDVVLMDVRMPRTDGLRATARVTADPVLSRTRVIVLTTFELDEYVFGALRAGAAGFLLKDMEPADVVDAVRIVAAGDALLAPRLTRRLIEAFVTGAGRPEPDTTPLEELTPREREVLTLVGQGLSNVEIADKLVVSPLTVKTHVARLFMKLGARDRAQLVVTAYETGLVTPGERR
jgi:DNA-binding NarL/FixJ family response regulator